MKWNALAVAALLFGPAASAQQTPAVESADVAIIARVRAKQLRFDKVPEVRVTFRGTGATVWKTDRTNLPDEVQPNVTYRDIGILLTITSTLPNIEQILDDALGTNTRGESNDRDSMDSSDPPGGGSSPGRTTAGTTAATNDDVD
jgi:hypothetical protein